ncbi:MAG: TonB family protein [Burkholderiales bacterium]|nr:TonB family protein [Burkholderiales bacterium]
MRLSASGAALGQTASPQLNRALLFSLLVHGLLLSLSFGQGVGLPGLELPWQQRRAEAPELRVVLEVPSAPLPAPAQVAQSQARARPADDGAPPVTPAEVKAEAAAEVRLLSPADLPTLDAPPARALLAVERPAVWAVAAASAVPTAVVAALAAASAPAVEPMARVRERLASSTDRTAELAQLAAPRPEASIAALQGASSPAIETLRRAGDALRLRSDRSADLAALAATRQEVTDLPGSVVSSFAGASSPVVEPLRRASDGLRTSAEGDRATDLAQLDDARQQAQQGAQRLEAARLEAARQEAARADAARQEAARAEAARLEAARVEAARLAAAKVQALAQARAEEEQREARLRAIGRQLDEEAARRDAERQRPDWAPARRGRLFGRTDANSELAFYGEAWARKIENNTGPDLLRDLTRQPHGDAMVTVAVRSNGSVESVTFVRSSGVPAVDEAIRRIVQSQENYPAFPPALLRDFDVVEIRRTWHFDTAVRLY